MTVSIQTLVDQHTTAKAKLSHYQAEEKKLRVKIVDTVFPNSVEGTQNHHYGNVDIKATFKMNRRINAKALDMELLTEAEKECVVFKPSLALAKYKALSDEERINLDESILTTPALPSIVITATEE